MSEAKETKTRTPAKPAVGTASSKTGAANVMENVMKNGTENWANQYEKMIAYGNGNVEAMVKASEIAANGFGEITQAVMSYVKAQMDEGAAASRAIMGAKDAHAMVEAQNENFRKFFDLWMNENKKISEMSYKTMSEAWAPITERVNSATDTWSKPVS